MSFPYSLEQPFYSMVKLFNQWSSPPPSNIKSKPLEFVAIPEEAIGEDPIGALSQSFEEMRAQLQNTQDAIVKIKSEIGVLDQQINEIVVEKKKLADFLKGRASDLETLENSAVFSQSKEMIKNFQNAESQRIELDKKLSYLKNYKGQLEEILKKAVEKRERILSKFNTEFSKAAATYKRLYDVLEFNNDFLMKLLQK